MLAFKQQENFIWRSNHMSKTKLLAAAHGTCGFVNVVLNSSLIETRNDSVSRGFGRGTLHFFNIRSKLQEAKNTK